MKGTIFNIQRFCTHDGPGIRTTVFLKGCPLRCAWCHNPESQSADVEVFSDGELCGREVTVEEVVDEVLRDREFYGNTGGMTLSGGEPLCQRAFSMELLKKAKEEGLHTAVETCGHVHEIEEFMPYVDLWLYDIKLLDTDAHRLWTGVGNERIMENLNKLGENVILRCPIIEGVNLCPEHFAALQTLGRPMEFLPYHPLGMDKAKKLGRTQSYENAAFLEKEKILSLFPEARIV